MCSLTAPGRARPAGRPLGSGRRSHCPEHYAPPLTTPPTSDNTDTSFDQQAAITAAFSKFNSSMSDAGSAFLKGQKSSIPGIGGYVEDIEKTVNNWQIVVADVYEAVNAITREQKRQTAGK